MSYLLAGKKNKKDDKKKFAKGYLSLTHHQKDFLDIEKGFSRKSKDGRLIIERFTGGSSDIPESRTYISALLPTSIKFEEY